MDIFDCLKSGEEVDLMSEEYQPAVEEMNRSRELCFDLNQMHPTDLENIHKKEEELFLEEGLDASSHIETPVQIDYGRQVKIGKNVFINHSLTMMAAGGVEIGDGTMIGPEACLLTTNHNFKQKQLMSCKKITIGKNVWFGARVTVMPGVVIGDNSVIAGGAVVTKDVPANCVAAGVPAKVVRKISS